MIYIIEFKFKTIHYIDPFGPLVTNCTAEWHPLTHFFNIRFEATFWGSKNDLMFYISIFSDTWYVLFVTYFVGSRVKSITIFKMPLSTVECIIYVKVPSYLWLSINYYIKIFTWPKIPNKKYYYNTLLIYLMRDKNIASR